MKDHKLPRHIALIMDGNGRWAQAQGQPRIQGHRAGVERVEEIIRAASAIGVGYITFYAFSKENWQRPKTEVNFLMTLLSNYLDKKAALFMEENIKFNTIGDVIDLPEAIQEKVRKLKLQTAGNTGMTVTFAISYSSRTEIVDACRKIAEKVKSGALDSSQIDETVFAAHLHTHDLPDPDLLIRTSGEMRISNYLLWQISYTELVVTEKCWPEFGRAELEAAIREYQRRERRFGKTETADAGTEKRTA